MADWYVSSANYNALPVWVASTAYSVGQIVRPTAPVAFQQNPQRCTVAGTTAATEPSWNTTIGGTTVSGGATFTNIGGQSASWGWNAAFGNIVSPSYNGANRLSVGDRVFIASDHVETLSNGLYLGPQGSGTIQAISVNRAGAIPPAAADELAGATLTISAGILECYCNNYWQGITFNWTGTTIYLASGGNKLHYFKNCKLTLAASCGRIGTNNPVRIILDNTTVQFGATTQGFVVGSSYQYELLWLNTPAAIVGPTLPAMLFGTTAGNASPSFTCRGVDLSAVTGSLFNPTGGASSNKLLFEGCRIAPGVVRYGPNGIVSTTNPSDEVDLVNCFDGTSVITERHTYSGDVTTDRLTTMAGGAQDDNGNYSLKLVSRATTDRFGAPLDSFWFDIENAVVGGTHFAYIEFIASLTLTTSDIHVLVEYLGTAGSTLANFASSLPPVLSTVVAAAGSTAIWVNPPSTPFAQRLAVQFSPFQAGRLRAQVRLGRPSTTIWVNPQIIVN